MMFLLHECLFRLWNNACPISQIITHTITDFPLSVRRNVLLLMYYYSIFCEFSFRLISVDECYETAPLSSFTPFIMMLVNMVMAPVGGFLCYRHCGKLYVFSHWIRTATLRWKLLLRFKRGLNMCPSLSGLQVTYICCCFEARLWLIRKGFNVDLSMDINRTSVCWGLKENSCSRVKWYMPVIWGHRRLDSHGLLKMQ